MSDRFEFTRQFVGEAFEEARDATKGVAPVNVEFPGFASLLTGMRGHLQGLVPRWVIEVYAHKLGKQLQLFRQNMGKMKDLVSSPSAMKNPTVMAMQAMAMQMDDFQFVIDHVNMYLSSGDDRALKLALETMEEVMQGWPTFVGCVQKNIEAAMEKRVSEIAAREAKKPPSSSAT